MRKILIFGNSGAGKSTLAKTLSAKEGLAHLDLDTLAWEPVMPPTRKPLAQSAIAISGFIGTHEGWVIEGCYTDLLQIAAPAASEILYLDLSVEDCIANARQRPWEPHKYASKAEQDANLEMLVGWISQYASRADTFSKSAHEVFYQGYEGVKRRYTTNEEASSGFI